MMVDVVKSQDRTSPPPRQGIIRATNARYGGVLLLVGVVGFLAGMAVAEIGYGPSYSLSQNLLSDLGVTSCGMIDSTGRYACSPWFIAFDAATVVLGLLVIYAAVWILRAFFPGTLRTAGLGLLAVNGVGLIVAGTTPENVNYSIHSAFALLAFACGALALATLGLAMRGTDHWSGFEPYTVASGVVSAVALFLFVAGADLGLGPGGMERLLVAPILLWSVVVGIHLVRTPASALGPAEARSAS